MLGYWKRGELKDPPPYSSLYGGEMDPRPLGGGVGYIHEIGLSPYPVLFRPVGAKKFKNPVGVKEQRIGWEPYLKDIISRPFRAMGGVFKTK